MVQVLKVKILRSSKKTGAFVSLELWNSCAELQKSALIQTGKLILGLNNKITKQKDNSLPFMRCECIYCQPWLVCDWFICTLWFPKDPSSNNSCRNAFSTVLSTPLALSETCPCLHKVLDWLTCRLRSSLDGRDTPRATGAPDSHLWATMIHRCMKGFFRSCRGQGKYLVNNLEIIWIYEPLRVANTGSPPSQAQRSQGLLRTCLRSPF